MLYYIPFCEFKMISLAVLSRNCPFFLILFASHNAKLITEWTYPFKKKNRKCVHFILTQIIFKMQRVIMTVKMTDWTCRLKAAYRTLSHWYMKRGTKNMCAHMYTHTHSVSLHACSCPSLWCHLVVLSYYCPICCNLVCEHKQRCFLRK